jgi:hypothetical protein
MMFSIFKKETHSGEQVPTSCKKQKKRDEYFEVFLKTIDLRSRRGWFELHTGSIHVPFVTFLE